MATVKGLRWPFKRKPATPTQVCWETGHITVNNIVSWFCPRCWTGWINGMAYPIDDAFKAQLRSGEEAIVKPNGRSWYHMRRKYVRPGVEIYDLDQVLAGKERE